MKRPRWHDEHPSVGTLVDEPNRTKQPLCVVCKHLAGFSPGGKPYCKAFSDGIPDKFWDAKADHTTPYDGDNGITFEP